MRKFRFPSIVIGNRKLVKRLLKQIQLLDEHNQELSKKNEELVKKLHSRRPRRVNKKNV